MIDPDIALEKSISGTAISTEDAIDALRQGANPFYLCENALTHLVSYLISEGENEALEQLHHAGVDLDIREPARVPAISFALLSRQLETAKLLIALGCDIASTDRKGRTPLFESARWGDYETTIMLLNRGADPNALAQYCRTPLFEAAIREESDIAEALIDHGADPFATDMTSKTAREYALDLIKFYNPDGTEVTRFLETAENRVRLRAITTKRNPGSDFSSGL